MARQATCYWVALASVSRVHARVLAISRGVFKKDDTPGGADRRRNGISTVLCSLYSNVHNPQTGTSF